MKRTSSIPWGGFRGSRGTCRVGGRRRTNGAAARGKGVERETVRGVQQRASNDTFRAGPIPTTCHSMKPTSTRPGFEPAPRTGRPQLGGLSGWGAALVPGHSPATATIPGPMGGTRTPGWADFGEAGVGRTCIVSGPRASGSTTGPPGGCGCRPPTWRGSRSPGCAPSPRRGRTDRRSGGCPDPARPARRCCARAATAPTAGGELQVRALADVEFRRLRTRASLRWPSGPPCMRRDSVVTQMPPSSPRRRALLTRRARSRPAGR